MVSEADVKSLIPIAFPTIQNYPNPFNAATQVDFLESLPPGRHQVQSAIYREPDREKLRKDMKLSGDLENQREKMIRIAAITKELYDSSFGEWKVQEVEVEPNVATELTIVLDNIVWVRVKAKLEP